MLDALSNHANLVRVSVFLAVLTALAVWELASPRRRLHVPRLFRWTNNILLVVVDTLVIRLVFPVAAAGFAMALQAKGWGLLNLIELPLWLAVALSMVALDFAIYCQHIVFHAVPVLWRLHRVHHADVDFDVTTGLRFHPLEIVISMAIKLCAVALLGAPAIAVLLFEILLNASSLFNHSNIKLGLTVDRALRAVLVTPDMHRVHHSTDPREMNRNFGFNLPWWDRLFRTYQAQPKDGHDHMAIGLRNFRKKTDQRLDRMLLQPFTSPEE